MSNTQSSNDGIEEHFYIPLKYYPEWNRYVIQYKLDIFRYGSTGIPLGKPKDSKHTYIEEMLAKRIAATMKEAGK